MTFSIIQKSQLESGQRIDPEYYQPEYLKIGRQLTSCPSLIELSTKITDFGAYSQMNFVKFVNSGVRFFRNQDVSEFTINDADPVYISKDTYERLSLKLEEQDIVTPRVGTLGNSAIIFKKSLPATANQNLAQIKPDRTKIDPVYLSIFLCSNYGKKQFERAATGNVQPWLNLQQIKSLKIFKPSSEFQSKVKQIALLVMEIVDKSDELYVHAQNILLQELGLLDFQISEDLAFEVNFSDLKNAGRMDADYFQPKYKWITNKIIKKKRMSEIAKRIRDIIKLTPNIEYKYIEISDINAGNGEVTFNRILGKELPANAKVGLNGGELIISKVRPTRGAVAIIPREFSDNFVASGAFSVFNVDYPMREYLQVVFRSIVGKLQLERPTTGTSYPTITDEDIENMWIPDLSLEIQQKIADFVRQSHEARKKSKELLEEAKRKVEEMIEKGAQNGQN